MAFISVGTLGATNSSTANQASIVHTTITNSVSSGNLVVVLIAVDNNQTTDGDESAVTSVADSAGNSYTKGAEFTNGQGGAQSGATVSVWFKKVTSGLTVGSTITANFSNSTSRDKACISAWVYSVAGGTVTIEVEATNTLANDGADPGSLDATTSNISCLRIRAIALETNDATAITTTSASWTAYTGTTTAGGGSAGNMALRGEFRIATGTSFASDPSVVAADCASVYVALKEFTPGTAIAGGKLIGGILTRPKLISGRLVS